MDEFESKDFRKLYSNIKEHNYKYNLHKESKRRYKRDVSDESSYSKSSRSRYEHKKHDRGRSRDRRSSKKNYLQDRDTDSDYTSRSSDTGCKKKHKSYYKNDVKGLSATHRHRKHDQYLLADDYKKRYRHDKDFPIKICDRMEQQEEKSLRIQVKSTPSSESPCSSYSPPGFPSTGVQFSAKYAERQAPSSGLLQQSAFRFHDTSLAVPQAPSNNANHPFQEKIKIPKKPSSLKHQNPVESSKDISKDRDKGPRLQITHSHPFRPTKIQKKPSSSLERQKTVESIKDISKDRRLEGPRLQTTHSNDTVVNQSTKESTNQFLKDLLKPANLRAIANLLNKLPTINNISDVRKIWGENTGAKDLATSTAVEGNNAAQTPMEYQGTVVDESRGNNVDTTIFVGASKEETKTTSTKVRSHLALPRDETSQQCQSDLPAVVSTLKRKMSFQEAPSKQVKLSNVNNALRKIMPPFKNNNPEYHSLIKTIQCPICDKSTHLPANHFVNNHPNCEVITSRLSQDVADSLRNSKNIFKCKRVRVPQKGMIKYGFKYAQFCAFCNETKCLRKDHWVTHLVTHTGYYRYKCTGCFKKFERIDRKHQRNCNKKIEEMPQPQVRNENLMAYICDLCNFVRFNKSEIKKHLHSEHDCNVTNSFKEVIFLRFPMVDTEYKGSENGLDTNDDTQETMAAEIDEVISNGSNTIRNRKVQSVQKRLLSQTKSGGEPEQKKPRMESLMPKPIIKNNNPNWHGLNTEMQCQVCDEPASRQLVNHYVNNHPEYEVPTSRLAPEAAKSLRSSIQNFKCKKTQPQRKRKEHQKIRQVCYFCNEYKSYTQRSWIEHLIKHSGYYPYECVDCSRKFVRNNIDHVCKDKNNIRKIPQPEFRNENLMAYVCNLCQYVRFSEIEIQKHLITQHEGNFKEDFKEFVFLRLPLNKTEEVGEHSHENRNDAEIIDDTLEQTVDATSVVALRATEVTSTSSTVVSSLGSSSLSICEGDSTGNSARDQDIILGNGQSAKMLIVLQSVVRLISFTLNESGTVQELLQQIGVPVSNHTKIETFTKPIPGIDYLVTVGVTYSGGPREIISKALSECPNV